MISGSIHLARQAGLTQNIVNHLLGGGSLSRQHAGHTVLFGSSIRTNSADLAPQRHMPIAPKYRPFHQTNKIPLTICVR